MKLLLDENLSRRLVPFLQQAYPGTSQVALLGLESYSDGDIWQYARQHGYVIVTKDADFQELAVLLGAPPKVVWLKTGNQSRADTLRILLDNCEAIENALLGAEQACIEFQVDRRLKCL